MEPASRALHAHRFLMRLGFGMVSAFTWLFLFELFVLLSGSTARSIAGVAIVYVLMQAVSLVLTPIAAAHLRRGIRPAMLAGTLLLSGGFVVLGATLSGIFRNEVLWGVILFAILLGAYRALYWIPYRIQESLEGEPVRLVVEFLIALMPAVAGASIALSAAGPERVLFGAAAFVLVSLVPTSTLPDVRESFAWHYTETFAQLLRPQHRLLLIHGFLDGIQGAALFLVWPIAVFFIVGASYLWLGVVISITLILLLILRRPLHRLLEILGIADSDTVRFTFAISGWIFRLGVASPLGIIVADSYAYLGAPRGRSAELHEFEQSADSSTYIDEYSTLKELSLALGRAFLAICFGLSIFVLPLAWAMFTALLIAALSSGGVVLLSRRMRVSV